MDVDKLKRVNQLSAVLRKHGLAACSSDAVELAGRISGKKEEVAFGSIIAGCEPAAAEEEKGSDEKMETKNTFTEEQIINILQKFADQFSDEIKSMKSKIQQQEDMIKQLTLHYCTSNSKTAEAAQSDEEIAVSEMIGETPEPVQAVTTIVQPQQQMAQTVLCNAPQPQPVAAPPPRMAQQQPAQQPSNPRTGSFDSEDVSIEKFFYFGNK
ncbi:hypothetical protein JXB31_03100 [Candidatus Woesearchaeota archaeon]|nr:hypothetical protein [Candidatus Woesearchaeota archaeon]